MALNGWSNTIYIEHGSDASLDDLSTITIMLWLFPTDGTARQCVFAKGPTGGTNQTEIAFNFQLSPARITVGRGRATASLVVEADTANFAAFGTSKWLCVVAQWDLSDVNNCKLLLGDLSTHAAEPSAYRTKTAGSGTINTDAADNLRIGRHPSATGRQFVGSYGWMGIWNRVLTATEIKEQQFYPHKTSGQVLACHYGFSGATASQVDLSASGNHGTVTGTPTVAAHVPLRPLFGWDAGAPYAVAAAGGTALPEAWMQYRSRRAA